MLKQFFKIQLFVTFVHDPQMLSCLSFISREKYGLEKKKIKPQIFFSVSRAFLGSGLYCSVCAGGWEGSPCALGGCLGAGGGSSPSWCVKSPQH